MAPQRRETADSAVDRPDDEAGASIRRALQAHAAMLEENAEGREVDVAAAAGDATALRVVAHDPADVARIRGPGYIGLVATGAHDRGPPWMVATAGRHGPARRPPPGRPDPAACSRSHPWSVAAPLTAARRLLVQRRFGGRHGNAVREGR